MARHVTSLQFSSLLCWYVKSRGVLMFLGYCVQVFSCSCIVSCSCIALMPLYSCPWYSCPCTHALVLSLIHDSLSVSLLFPASIILSLVFHGFVYVLPVWSFIKPLFLYIVHLGPTFLFHRLRPSLLSPGSRLLSPRGPFPVHGSLAPRSAQCCFWQSIFNLVLVIVFWTKTLKGLV